MCRRRVARVEVLYNTYMPCVLHQIAGNRTGKLTRGDNAVMADIAKTNSKFTAVMTDRAGTAGLDLEKRAKDYGSTGYCGEAGLSLLRYSQILLQITSRSHHQCGLNLVIITNPTVAVDVSTSDADADASPHTYLVTPNMLMGKTENRIDICAKLREYCIRGRGLQPRWDLPISKPIARPAA